MTEREKSSFRDPEGYVFLEDGEIYRNVKSSYKEDYEKLMESGLYSKLVEDNLLVGHEELETEDCYRKLKPEKVKFITYPYEWSFSQLKDAAILMLRVQEIAIEHGMSLKDASAYNIQFKDGKPILIDTLSFEKNTEKFWKGYRQFCRHFLAPLALMAYRDQRLLSIVRTDINGIPLDLASKLLPRRTKLRLGILIHIHLHAIFEKKYSGKESCSKRKLPYTRPGSIIKNLKTTIEKLGYKREKTERSKSGENQSDSQRKQIFKKYLNKVDPEQIWNIYATDESFSEIAAEKTQALTVSMHPEPAKVEDAYIKTREKGRNKILPLKQDLENPSPGLGWRNMERKKLEDRGNPDLGIALNIVHRLAIANNLPLNKIAGFMASNFKTLIIEFIHKEDESTRNLLSSREDIFKNYTRENFEEEFEKHYRISQKDSLDNSKRTFYLMRRLK